MHKHVFTRIRQLRSLKGISQQYMAVQLGISQSAYSKLERNKIHLDLDRLAHIAQILRISCSDFLSCNMQIELEQDKKFGLESERISPYETQIKLLTEEIHLLRSQLLNAGFLD